MSPIKTRLQAGFFIPLRQRPENVMQTHPATRLH